MKDGHEITDAIIASNAWNQAHQIPGVPSHANPHIYCAYMTKLVKRWPVSWMIYEQLILPNIFTYIEKCEEPLGYVSRFPKSNESSHDEFMGAAYHASEVADRMVERLSKTDGILENSEDERHNNYRFVFFRAFLRACGTNHRVGLASQLAYIAHLIPAIIKVPGPDQCSGILKAWLMNDRMEKYPLVAVFILIWRWRLEAAGWTAKKIFSQHYLSDHQIFSQRLLIRQ